MNPDRARRVIAETTTAWVDDPHSAVVWAGEHEGRPGLRMAQTSRDFTTIWFDVGERTVAVEAYLVPPPTHSREEVYRQCLVRNLRSWPVSIAMDRNGDLYVIGRIPLEIFDAAALDQIVGAVYELVEVAFRPLVRAGFASREKTS